MGQVIYLPSPTTGGRSGTDIELGRANDISDKRKHSLADEITEVGKNLSERVDKLSAELYAQNIEILERVDQQRYNTSSIKVIISLCISLLIGGGLSIMAFLSHTISAIAPPLFWVAILLPVLGIAAGSLIIILGVDRDQYD